MRSWPEVDQSAKSSVELKNECSYKSALPVRVFGMGKDKFTFRATIEDFVVNVN